MCVCVWVCGWVWVCGCMWVSVCVGGESGWVWVSVHVRVCCAYACVWVYLDLYTCALVPIYIYMCVCVCNFVSVCISMNIYISVFATLHLWHPWRKSKLLTSCQVQGSPHSRCPSHKNLFVYVTDALDKKLECFFFDQTGQISMDKAELNLRVNHLNCAPLG